MKRTIILGTAMVLAGAMLSGCGGGDKGTAVTSDKGAGADARAAVEKDGATAPKKIGDLVANAANKALVEKITDQVIVAGYIELNAKVGLLVDALAAFENDPTQAKLTAAQAAWKAARVPWESGEGHIFGPIDTLGVDPASDSWPVSTSDLDGSLEGWAIGNPVDSFPDEIKGFHAIEFILFGDGSKTNTRNVADMGEKQIAYARALGEAMKKQTQILMDAWNKGYTATFKGLESAAAAEELLGGMIGIVDEVGNGKMGEPLTNRDTTLVESQFSWNTTTDLANNLTSIKNVWDAGMGGLIAQIDTNKADEIGREIDDAIAKIKRVSDADGDGEIDPNVKEKAFRNQISDDGGRVLIQEAIGALAKLQASLESLVS